MIRQLLDATTDPTHIHPGLADHQAAMIERCPYLGPSVAKDLTIWSAFAADAGDERELLNLLVWYAEQVRIARRTDGPLTCRNIAIFGPSDAAAARALLDWPAWLARNLYAPAQLMVDRFWIGIGRNPEKGRSVMPPLAVSFFMVRCGLPRKERLIVSPRPANEMASLRAGPGDDGRDVIATVLGRTVERPSDAWDDLTTAFPVSTHAA